jgi:glycosyltransferase involved in cell wall biosynthesis
MRTGNPLLLTEHGLYVRERAIDIARADWIHEEPVRVRLARPGGNPLKEMWINFFATLGQITYDAADEVIALFGGNMDLQVQLGADPQRTRVIPNGVDVESYAPLRGRRAPAGSRPLRVGFVGRVVPIKDVKTLIKACALVARKMPSVEYWIVGPTDEDETYSAECRELVATLGLGKLKFTGMQDVKNIYPEIDVMVLTSISEGQPLTVLEAACAGVPTVATDVGACRELIEGRLAEDRALGPGGRVTGVGAPEQTASAVLEILGSDELREQMAKSGVTRTEKFYRQSQVLSRYSELYKRHLST